MYGKVKSGPQVSPRLSPDGERQQAARRAREAEALRLNLLKRKAQARGRLAAPKAAPEAEPAGPAPGPARTRGG